ncbi:TPA: MFS transporter [Klebsiella quasipneumoniae subsp. similipneumoniae]|uniref:MFS transporter n=1 Tax=Klebsiella TaxID=570 RepID=UPI0009BBF46C|nr:MULTISPECIES: MFS transporter [Klebsiella]EKU6355667.1 MHS family MFS transporter [Klebsiella quasipneumoniae]MBY7098794.1 MHS family MFS transporter [Klebsiella quasipneumoniae]MCQ1488916.1 MHS family MFS transporter [Klebsiella pneumoniae]MDF9967867.1 MHS family MFS transporter [Klebsiella pneumoniae]MEB5581786.1 MHS family MFS transporter [Klebsiella quasipneumoniae]
MRKLIIGSFLGNSLEWYDFFLYGTAAALVFGALFFPVQDDPLISTLLAFSGFAVGFIARPLGGILFGHIGDKYSRKTTLIITLTLMGASTFLIGLLPTWHQVGVLAPIALISLRFLQGVASGGEWGGGVLMLSENAPEEKKGYYTAWSQVGVSGGFVLSALAFWLVQLLPENAFMTWGWRIPFLMSVFIFLVGIYIRKNIRENKEFTQLKQASDTEPEANVPVIEIFKKYPKQLLQAIGLRLPENGAVYIFFTFSVVFCKHVGIASDKIIAVVTLAMMLEIFSILFWGWLSDRIGRKTIYYIGVIGLLLTAFPFFSLLASGNFSLMMLAMMLGLPLCHGAMIAAQPCIMSELFPVEVRYTGLALGHEIGAVISGGISPMIAVALLLKYDHWWPISVMLLGFALVALIALLSIKVSPRALSSRTAS